MKRSYINAVLILLTVGTFSHAFLSQNAVPRGNAPARNSCTRQAFVNDDRDDEMGYRTRYTGDSDAARELQNLQYDDDDQTLDIVKEDYYYEDDEDLDYDDGEEELYIDEEVTGNFWINPKQGFDSLPSERRRTSRIEEATGDHPVRRPRPRPVSGKARSKCVTYFILRS